MKNNSIEMSITSSTTVPSASQLFLQTILDAYNHQPQAKQEAVALYRLVMKTDIEPLIDMLAKACVAQLPAAEQGVALVAITAVEAEAASCGCW